MTGCGGRLLMSASVKVAGELTCGLTSASWCLPEVGATQTTQHWARVLGLLPDLGAATPVPAGEGVQGIPQPRPPTSGNRATHSVPAGAARSTASWWASRISRGAERTPSRRLLAGSRERRPGNTPALKLPSPTLSTTYRTACSLWHRGKQPGSGILSPQTG